MTTTKKNTKRVAIVGGTVAALMGGGIAFAAWTSTGTGNGSATAGTAAELGVTQVGTTTGLLPDGSQPVDVKVTNPNDYSIQMDSVVKNGGTTATGGIGTCTASAVTTADKTDLTDVVPAHGDITYRFVYTMDANADNGCQSAVFTIPFKATGHSVAAH